MVGGSHPTVFMTNAKRELTEVLTGPERWRWWSTEEKFAGCVKAPRAGGKTVSKVVCRHGVSPGQLFHWRKLYQDGTSRRSVLARRWCRPQN